MRSTLALALWTVLVVGCQRTKATMTTDVRTFGRADSVVAAVADTVELAAAADGEFLVGPGDSVLMLVAVPDRDQDTVVVLKHVGANRQVRWRKFTGRDDYVAPLRYVNKSRGAESFSVIALNGQGQQLRVDYTNEGDGVWARIWSDDLAPPRAGIFVVTLAAPSAAQGAAPHEQLIGFVSSGESISLAAPALPPGQRIELVGRTPRTSPVTTFVWDTLSEKKPIIAGRNGSNTMVEFFLNTTSTVSRSAGRTRVQGRTCSVTALKNSPLDLGYHTVLLTLQ